MNQKYTGLEVIDTDHYFVVDAFTRMITSKNPQKDILIQNDHNSERFTFEIPRFIEGRDVGKCNVIQVCYRNGRSSGVYTVDDLAVYPFVNDAVICSWLISRNATAQVGSLEFMLRFAQVNDDATVEYAWSTKTYNRVQIVESIDSVNSFEGEYVDAIQQWKNEVMTAMYEDVEYTVASQVDVAQITTNRQNIDTLTNRQAVLQSRMNAFASLEEGATTGDAELTDLRVDFEGSTGVSAGEAVRRISEKLYAGYKAPETVAPDHTTFLTSGSKNLFSKRICFVESWVNSSGIIHMANHFASYYIPCAYGEIFSCTAPITFSEVHFFNDAKERLGSITIDTETTSFIITNPNARYFIIQSENILIDSLMVNRGDVLLDYEAWDGMYKFGVTLSDIENLFDSRKYFHVSSNLFVRTAIRENTWFNQTNGFIKLNNYFCTDYIDLNVGKYIFSTKKLPASPGAVEIHIFDENYNWLKTIELKNLCGPDNDNYILNVEYANYKYMVFQMNMSYMDVGFVINYGDTLSEYTEGGEYLKTKYLDADAIAELMRIKMGVSGYEIILPDNIYLRDNGANEQYNIYFDNIFGGKKPPIVDVVCNYGKQLEECWRYETNASGYSKASGSFDLTINGLNEELEVIVSKTVKVNIVNASSTDPIVYLAIGDSITSQGHYVEYLQSKVDNLSTMGLVSAIGQEFYREGRSGWSLNNYLNNIGREAYSNEFNIDSPFLYPVGYDAVAYKGNTSQMKSIVANRGTYILPFIRKAYMTDGEYDYDSDGYFKNPKIGDYMCDPTLTNKWVQWDGAAWVAMNSQPTEFEFSFSKYMARYATIFNGKTPTHVSICLGANDFQQNTPTEATIDTWYNNLLTVINSIKEYDENIVIMLFAPPLGADQNAWRLQLNSGATSYNYYKNLKLLEKMLISKHAEDDNIYIAPMIEMIDTEYAYDKTTEKRNAYTDDTVTRHNNWVHPNASVGHNQMSDALLGIFEKTR